MRYKYLILALFLPTSAYAKRYRKLNQARLAKAVKQNSDTTNSPAPETVP